MLMANDFAGRPNRFPADDDDDEPMTPDGVTNEPQEAAAGNLPEDPEPWPIPVDAADLFDEIQTVFTDHVVMGNHGHAACALWVTHTFCFKLFTNTPRLFIHAPTHASGKSTVLDLLEKLVHRPLAASDATGAAVVRQIEAYSPTLLVDEHDSMHHADSLRNIFNSGFARGKRTIRCDGVYHTFSPFGLASTSRLPPAMFSRCVVLLLQRKLPTEKIKPVSTFDGTKLKRKIARWLIDNQEALAQAQPKLPRGITDRLADAWRPLLAIADRADRKWPALAREAAVALSTRYEPPSVAELLLADIREVFGADEALFSSELVSRLLAKNDGPWTGEGLNEWMLAQKLEPFGIYPKKMRLGAENKRGYRRNDFTEAWRRWKTGTV